MGQQFDRFSFFDGLEMEPVTQVNWSDYWRGVIPDGVVAEVGEEMRPYANSTGMYVYVSTGACIVDNHRGVNSALKIMPVNTADTTYDRIDLLVARVVYGNENESYMELDILTGTPAIDPVAPTVTQSTGDIYEIALAEIYVTAEAITITESDVADLRNVFTAASQSISFINDDSVALTKGMLVQLSRDNADSIKRCPSGKAPIGVVTSDSIAVGARGQVATISGRVAEIACSTKKVTIGDALIPSSTPGIAETGGGYAGGLALEGKDAGAVGNVKALLAVMSKISLQNGWYLPDGIMESDVIAAYQFIDMPSEADALVNINDGIEYALTKSVNTITWDTEKGFYFPATANIGLYNGNIKTNYADVYAAAFGFHSVNITAGTNAGGVVISRFRNLQAKGHWYQVSAANAPTINYSATSAVGYKAANAYAKGVLGGNWSTTSEMFMDGSALSITSLEKTYSNENYQSYMVMGNTNETTHNFTTFYCTAVVLYGKILSAAQHLELANNIRTLGGLE